MLNLVVKTKLDAEKALRSAFDYFIVQEKLTLVEWIGHMHAERGACELRISGGEIRGDGSHGKKAFDSGEILLSEVERLTRDYGFKLAYYGLHIHTPDSDVGHLMVSVQNTDPVELTFESHEMDFPVRAFSEKVPRA